MGTPLGGAFLPILGLPPALSKSPYLSASWPGSKGPLAVRLTQGKVEERDGSWGTPSLGWDRASLWEEPVSFSEGQAGRGRHRVTGRRRGLLPSGLRGSGRVYGPGSDLTNPFTIHHPQQLVWLRSINSPSDRRCLFRFSNKPPGHDPSLGSINTAACGPLPRLGPSWAQQPEECGQYLLLPPCPREGQRDWGSSGCLLC